MFKRFLTILLCCIMLAACLCACDENSQMLGSAPNEPVIDVNVTTVPAVAPTDPDDDSNENMSDVNGDSDGDGSEIDGAVIEPGSINLSDFDTNVIIKTKGEYTLSGVLSGIVYVKTEGDVVLKLNGVTISNNDGPCIYVENAEMIAIHLVGGTVNTLSTNGNVSYTDVDAAIYSQVNTRFGGNGTIKIENRVGRGVNVKGSLVIDDGAYVINSENDCINVKKDFAINRGVFSLVSNQDEGLQSDKKLIINNGEFNINAVGDAVRAKVLLEINGGVFDIITENEGLESKGEMVINGGALTINAVDDGINAIESLVINGGEIYVLSSTNDAIDSNGPLEINGGFIYAVGLTAPEGAIDADVKRLSVNGGTVIGVGAINTQQHEGEQNVIVINPLTEAMVEKIEIKNEGNEIVFECKILPYSIRPDMFVGTKFDRASFMTASFLLTSPNFSDGTYLVYVNGELIDIIVVSSNWSVAGNDNNIKF